MFCPDFSALLGPTDGSVRMKQPSGKSTQCPKPAHRIWLADADFLLATEPEMCYTIPVKASTVTVPSEKPGSIILSLVIMTLVYADLLMRMMHL
jgi:hypothetical protein